MNRLIFLPQDAVVWGHDTLSTAAASLDQYDIRQPLVFTIEHLRGFYAQHLQEHIKGVRGTFTRLPAHVPDVAVSQGLDACTHAKADSIVALGGGSVLDTAKAVSHLHQQKTGRPLRIAAFPTTLSGSEFSHYFGVTETSGTQPFKRSYAVRDSAPTVVVLDPRLLINTPRELLLSSAIKGIDHAVEGMRQVNIDHPHAVLAAAGVERFFDVLEKWPDSLDIPDALAQRLISMEDLLQLQLAAWQCYFFPASVIYGLSHRIGHILGGSYGLPHSLTSCVTLAPVLRACGPRYGDKLQIFTGGHSVESAAGFLAGRIAHVVERVQLPHKLRDFRFDRSQLANVAALLQQHYATEVGDIGEGGNLAIGELLESMW